MSYAEGDRVEVYDGDRDRWCPGTVQSPGLEDDRTGPSVTLGDIIMVKADEEMEYGLPLMWGVPMSAADQLIRPLVEA